MEKIHQVVVKKAVKLNLTDDANQYCQLWLSCYNCISQEVGNTVTQSEEKIDIIGTSFLESLEFQDIADSLDLESIYMILWERLHTVHKVQFGI